MFGSCIIHILYIYSTNIGTEYFKRCSILSVFFCSKCSLFHNANLFGSCIIHILYTGCAKIKKNNSGAKGLTTVLPRSPHEITPPYYLFSQHVCHIIPPNIQHACAGRVQNVNSSSTTFTWVRKKKTYAAIRDWRLQDVPETRIAFRHTTTAHKSFTNHSLNPCSTVLLEKPTGSHLVQKSPAFYGTRRFIQRVDTCPPHVHQILFPQ